MRLFLVVHVSFSLLISFILGMFVSAPSAASFGGGAALIAANFIVIRWIVAWILVKKRIALAISVIVLKYTLLLLAIYTAAGLPNVSLLWFGIGVTSISGSSLIWWVLKTRFNSGGESKIGSI